MRWKAFQFLGKIESQARNNHEFKSSKCPPSTNELSNFESDLLMIIHDVKFKQ